LVNDVSVLATSLTFFMKQYIEITIPLPAGHDTGMLVAALSEYSFEGMEETDNELKVFFSAEKIDRTGVARALADLNLAFTETVHEEKNWNEEWEIGFTPVVIGDYAAVRANFHQPIGGVEHEIVITPKMSFGTGHHSTTSMMIRMMRKIDFEGKSVLDFGTGTGILAILASKLKAGEITAVDNDEWSIANARENLDENRIANVRLLLANDLKGLLAYDIILANINLNVLTGSVEQILSVSKKGCSLLMSGFYETDVPAIQQYFTNDLFKLNNQLTEEKWTCLLMEKL
jgi:ribosomal protein L11 methyltransferase